MNTHMKLLSTALFSVAMLGALPASADNHGDEHMDTHESAGNTGQQGEDKTSEHLPTQRDAGDEVEAGSVGTDNVGNANKHADSTVDGPDGVNGGGATAQ